MTNTEIKVGDLVGWDDGIVADINRALVVGGPFGDRGERALFRVRWLTGHLKGDTMVCNERFLFVLSDLKNKKQTA